METHPATTKLSKSDLIRVACETNDVEKAQQSVLEGVDVNARIFAKDDYMPPLACAILNNSTDVAQFLCQSCDIDIYRALRCVVEHGTVDQVKFLLEHNADVNAKELEDTPLLSSPVSVDMAKHLVSVGLNVKNPKIAMLGHQTSLDTIKALVEAGADVNATDSLNYTPLMWYFDNDEWDLDVVEYFASLSTNLNNGGNYGRSTLDKALSRAEEVSNGAEAVRILLKYGAKPLFQEVVNVSEKPALLRVLLEGKVDPNMTFKFPDGPTVSLLKAFKGSDVDAESIALLKEFGAVDSATDADTDTDTDTA